MTCHGKPWNPDSNIDNLKTGIKDLSCSWNTSCKRGSHLSYMAVLIIHWRKWTHTITGGRNKEKDMEVETEKEAFDVDEAAISGRSSTGTSNLPCSNPSQLLDLNNFGLMALAMLKGHPRE
ncbi:hypothetical protein PIB30_019093 [Stylosanthes scabra]|uniref:Uncharacterized protein n=1 Tax=Stylosanthes scabra TaxID=79078 RepID=A0ABU6U9Y1_9FABA|nr:hypothetical protein [Stylosanthes scabra]